MTYRRCKADLSVIDKDCKGSGMHKNVQCDGRSRGESGMTPRDSFNFSS
jgi:hypothetical protein